MNSINKTSAAATERRATPLELSESKEGNCPEDCGTAELPLIDADAEVLCDDDALDSDSRLCDDAVFCDSLPLADPVLLWVDDSVFCDSLPVDGSLL